MPVLCHTISAYRGVGERTHEQRRDAKEADRWRRGVQRRLLESVSHGSLATDEV